MFAAFDVTAVTKALGEAEIFITALVTKKAEQHGIKLERQGPRWWRWTPINSTQAKLMSYFTAVSKDLKGLPELNAWAKETAEELNQILQENGFSIRLEHWDKSPDRFGVVAIYDIKIEWLMEGKIANEEGIPYIIPSNGKPAFQLDGELNQIQFHKVGDRVIVKIPGKNEGDFLCFVKAEKPLEQFELLQEAEGLKERMSGKTRISEYGGVVMPNIVFDTGNTLDINWLRGMYFADPAEHKWYITEAKMQAKFALGRKGARAKVAVTVAILKGCTAMFHRPDYIADHDLLLWMERDSVSVPFFVAYVGKDEFADHQVEMEEIG